MKKLLFLMACLFASGASANWEVNQNGVAIQFADGSQNRAAILELANNKFYVSFVEYYGINYKCEEDKNTVRSVNGQPIKLLTTCDKGMNRNYALTDNGRQFIVNEFKSKNNVKFGSATYSAAGFSAVMKELKKRQDWEKDAL